MLAILVVIAMLIPRVGRFITREINQRVEDTNTAQETKTQLAITSVVVYIVQLVAYFLVFVYMLKTLGFSLTGAAIPATVASAAIGLGSQSIIADFLAGFFILTEKQYGVGDWVRFEGPAVAVEGTVIQITMRATRIRTLADETVMIPNSTAKICINSSNHWSSAVVILPVPLLGSKNPRDAIARCEKAGQRALEEPEINQVLLGELQVHPAVSILPPSTVGMPWMVNMRLIVQVQAGFQWMVERAIRTAILEEFWDEYGSATTVSGALRTQVSDAEALPATATQLFSASSELSSKGATKTASGTAGTEGTAGTAAFPPSAEFPVATEKLETDPAIAEVSGASEDSTNDKNTKNSTKLLANQPAWKRFFSLNGRVRASTSILILSLAALVFLWASTVQTGEEWEGNDGWLAPSRSFSSNNQDLAPSPTLQPTPTVIPSTTAPSSTPETEDPALESTETTTESETSTSSSSSSSTSSTTTTKKSDNSADSEKPTPVESSQVTSTPNSPKESNSTNVSANGFEEPAVVQE
ncbi:putative MscS family protein YkuT [Corynebacterium caspium DSM 44850]|nr:putative MscS family protein YkuT [Corynebacterium caspium DSM 44850]